MALPKYTKITKNGIEYISGADRCNYSITELTRAALRDVGKYVCKIARKSLPKKTGRARKNVQYWVRSKQPQPDLQVGYKPSGFYGGFYETGTSKTPKVAPLYNAIADSLDDIQRIEAEYLNKIEDDNETETVIDEGETISDDQ